jgi:PAS domain S-box-containing protein
MNRNLPDRPTADSSPSRPVSLVGLLARESSQTGLLTRLHAQLLEVTGGSRSVLFEYHPDSRILHATSASHPNGLTEIHSTPWSPDTAESTLVDEAFARSGPTHVPDARRKIPDLASRAKAAHALLLPLALETARVGLVVVAVPGGYRPGFEADAVGELAHAFLAATELLRLRRAGRQHEEIRTLLGDVLQTLSSTLTLSAGLEVFCQGANRLMEASRTSVWIYDRRARSLVVRASSDPAHAASAPRAAADDPHAPAAMALRRTTAEALRSDPAASTATITVPLRGTRRALGTLVFEEIPAAVGEERDALDRAGELGRHLSSAVENLQLLDDVIRSRRELENTFDSIAHLIVVADRRGHIVHANRSFALRVGQPRGSLVDRALGDFVGPELASWLTQHDQMAVRPGEGSPATCEIVDPKLKGPFMVTATDLLNHDQERVGSVVVARDLTPQTKLEAEREELRQRLTQSEKLAALGQFVAGIAHELNNPLQGVLGHLELLRVTGAIPKQLKGEVRTIYREADRAAKIVRNLLVFAGSPRLTRRSVSLNGILQKVLALRSESCRAANIEVVRHYDDKLPRVKSDPLLLHQVFLNMVMNAEHAVESTGGSGRIEVTTAVAPQGDRIVATVRDTGPGISPEALSRIFEPFFTTKEVGKGTGLGLAIAYGIVQEHGGQIVAGNHPEGGAVLTVELPASKRTR